MKIICLDYDGTYTEFPYLMRMIIEYGNLHNIKVILATMRYPEEADIELKELQKTIDVYFTSRKAKGAFLHNLGILPDIWIDDNPWFITQDAK
jgi:hypothetical protein